MKTVTRTRELATATVLALATTAAVWLASAAGWKILTAFVAGAGSAITVGYVALTNMAIRQARIR